MTRLVENPALNNLSTTSNINLIIAGLLKFQSEFGMILKQISKLKMQSEKNAKSVFKVRTMQEKFWFYIEHTDIENGTHSIFGE